MTMASPQLGAPTKSGEVHQSAIGNPKSAIPGPNEPTPAQILQAAIANALPALPDL